MINSGIAAAKLAIDMANAAAAAASKATEASRTAARHAEALLASFNIVAGSEHIPPHATFV